ncbi:murein hydrolase activator EnvC family protein [Sphingobacterium sp. SG20118]|uniref:murein hydrolase activator EnvC family protein n=1 Tax=Sphingobacterium TaxID=28453 RepID=UPI0004F83DCF|nr:MULTISPECIES: peptidoglycan DD-metalloendopeptidase family protein [Sphingobacterium]AIM38517.1 peptidase M23 [Sphingobacterium sp. ML3W]MDH5825489.1 peptidoglycan DD-metalloendopeptidase family protein [Sphingobacterium faecium]
MNFKRTTLSIIAFFLMLGVGFSQTRAELEKKREKINREIAELQKTLKETTTEKLLTQKQVSALSSQINLRQEKISTISTELSLINRQINANTNAVDKLKAELEKMRNDYEKMVMFAFRNRNAYNKLMFIFASKDFNQGFRRVKYLQQFNDSRKLKASEIEGTKKQIEQKIAQLQADRNKHKQLLNEQEQEKKTIAEQRAVFSKELSSLITTEKGVKSDITQKQKEERKLRSAIQAIIKREIEAERRRQEAARRAAEAAAARSAKKNDTKEAPKEATKSTARKSDSEVLRATPEAARLSADFRSNRGRLPWPVSNAKILQSFGTDKTGRNVSVSHESLKLQTSSGAGVKAVFSGTVTSTLTLNGLKVIIISHGEFFSVYSNLASFNVSKGQKVSAGQAIGTVANDPDLDAPVLDFQIWQGQIPMNPQSWLAN